jgi:hypothetical protein
MLFRTSTPQQTCKLEQHPQETYRNNEAEQGHYNSYFEKLPDLIFTYCLPADSMTIRLAIAIPNNDTSILQVNSRAGRA